MDGHTVNSCSIKDQDDNTIWAGRNESPVTCEDVCDGFCNMLQDLQSCRRAEAGRTWQFGEFTSWVAWIA